MKPFLSIKNLNVQFAKTYAVKDVSFDMYPGEVLAIVGESGSGKTTLAQALLRLQKANTSGEIWFENENLLPLCEKALQQIRGKKIGMIFQDPMTSLNPTMRVGKQIAESLQLHRNLNRTEIRNTVLELLTAVGIAQPELRIDQYPHEYSGGMRQRAMIAIAIACQPTLLIADEPTTALDVTIQTQILRLLKDLNQTRGTAIMLITHDLGVVAGIADRVIVIHQGHIVETAATDDLFYHPQHAYTQSLLASLRRKSQ